MLTENKIREIINQYRIDNNNLLLSHFECKHNGKTEYGYSFDENYWNRKDLILDLYKNYDEKDKPLIKWLIQQESKGSEYEIPQYTIDICAFMLYKHMEVLDIYELYDIKFGLTSDIQCFVDIELIFGFDKEQMKDFLKNEKSNKRLNNKILKTINYYESQLDAIYRNRDAYINYFETKKIINIKNELEEFEEYYKD